MKTVKKLIGIVLLVMLATSAFAKNPFLPQAKSFSNLKYYSLTTSYTVHFAYQTTTPGYTGYAWVTLTGTNSFSSRLTMPADFDMDVTVSVGGFPATFPMTIYQGTSYGTLTFGYGPYGAAPVIDDVDLSVSSYNGDPIYVDYTFYQYQ
ncbi:hypothetical protein DJ568_08550 [Mucilaginibacter hurinus]|uniref:Uncharacterized protein n=1 Tax=Mucilaginibacter hurinus TaxID=2201324 RepID=A0A367GP21_9SPHI|nr:hypothetical protein [Mucilaginibacter hurinus]RCH55227.1 hypothetical protein DJ568_08550 [Mucilaginibacter hurinus]